MSQKPSQTNQKTALKAALVPKLRFPDFRDSFPWTSISLGEASTPVTERVGDRKLTPVSISAGIGFVSQSEKFGRDISGNQYQLYTLLRDGDFVYNKGNSLKFPEGCIYLLKDWGQVAAPNVFICFRLKECFYGVKIPTPNLTEQQKIADCLSSLDELIAAQARKVAALKTHKKGLMQQLFPREGETQPRQRFPEFRNAAEWEERKAGSLFANRATKGEHGLPIYSVTMNDGMVKRESLDRKVDDIKDAAGNKKVFRRDIAYNMMRMWQGALGVAPEDCLVSPAYVVLAPKIDAVPQFFQYMFKLPAMLLLLTSHSRGLTKDRLRLYFDDFARIAFRCPPPREQQRIADSLISLDTLINAATQELDTLKTHKKGLMQQLFPYAEAVEA